MLDWTAVENIIINPGQFSEDCEGTLICDRDYPVQGTGRDLKKFAYTWDDNYLSFYVERWASSTNTTDWLFYLDKNANDAMESDEPIFRVSWSGSNQRTNAMLCPYYPVDPSGDELVDVNGYGDGYSMPGGSANSLCTSLYSNVVGGSSTGTAMESRISWSQLGMAGPANIKFHISSATGMNLPSQLIDNMDGPGNGQGLFPPDMRVDISADKTSLSANGQLTFDISLTHIHFDDFVDIQVDWLLPPQFAYVSHSAPAGTVFIDSDASGSPDLWQIPLLQENNVLTLQVTAIAQQVPFPMTPTVAATISAWDAVNGAEDSDVSNNQASIGIEILPAPALSVTKISSQATARPADVISYTVLVSNTGTVDAHNVQLTDKLGHFTSLGMATYGAGQPFDFLPGTSGLTIGTPAYSDNDGLDWTYVPPATGYDAAITHVRLPFVGVMPGGSSFTLRYDVRVD
ncbi:MAG TPA: hypothetical protein VIN71_08160 [Pseudomonadales bacterium]